MTVGATCPPRRTGLDVTVLGLGGAPSAISLNSSPMIARLVPLSRTEVKRGARSSGPP